MVTLLSMVTTMATRHHNQSASRIPWKLPLKSNLPLMVSFMQRDPDQNVVNVLLEIISKLHKTLKISKISLTTDKLPYAWGMSWSSFPEAYDILCEKKIRSFR